MLCEILLQPFPLHGRFTTAPNLGAFAVQRKDVPLPEIVTVICLRRITRHSTKIATVSAGCRQSVQNPVQLLASNACVDKDTSSHCSSRAFNTREDI